MVAADEGMTEEALAVARAEEACDEVVQRIIGIVVEDLPAAIEDAARRLVESQPEVTERLGVEGLRLLRARIKSGTGATMEGVREGLQRAPWPHRKAPTGATTMRWSGVDDEVDRLVSAVVQPSVDQLRTQLEGAGYTRVPLTFTPRTDRFDEAVGHYNAAIHAHDDAVRVAAKAEKARAQARAAALWDEAAATD